MKQITDTYKQLFWLESLWMDTCSSSMLSSFPFAFLLQTCDNHHHSIFHLIQEPEVGSPPRPIYYQRAKNSPKSHHKSRPHADVEPLHFKLIFMFIIMVFIIHPGSSSFIIAWHFIGRGSPQSTRLFLYMDGSLKVWNWLLVGIIPDRLL